MMRYTTFLTLHKLFNTNNPVSIKLHSQQGLDSEDVK